MARGERRLGVHHLRLLELGIPAGTTEFSGEALIGNLFSNNFWGGCTCQALPQCRRRPVPTIVATAILSAGDPSSRPLPLRQTSKSMQVPGVPLKALENHFVHGSRHTAAIALVLSRSYDRVLTIGAARNKFLRRLRVAAKPASPTLQRGICGSSRAVLTGCCEPKHPVTECWCRYVLHRLHDPECSLGQRSPGMPWMYALGAAAVGCFVAM